MGRSTQLRVTFAGGRAEGRARAWQVTEVRPVRDETLPSVAHLQVLERRDGEPFAEIEGSVWQLRGVTSYDRYVSAAERAALIARQPPLGRPEATCAALIPIAKSAAWWAL